MKKVIVKVKLSDRDKFEEALDRQGRDLTAMYWQHDRVYVPRGYKRGQNFPRLVMRTNLTAVDAPPHYSMILRRHIEDAGVDVVEETPVADYVGAVNIILQLGFKQAGEVSRRRQDLTVEEGTILHVDEIDGHNVEVGGNGTAGEAYVKVETILSPESSVGEVRGKIMAFLQSLEETEVAETTYFEM